MTHSWHTPYESVRSIEMVLISEHNLGAHTIELAPICSNPSVPYEWVMTRLTQRNSSNLLESFCFVWVSHGTHMNESCITHMCDMTHSEKMVPCDMTHSEKWTLSCSVWVSNSTHMNTSYVTHMCEMTPSLLEPCISHTHTCVACAWVCGCVGVCVYLWVQHGSFVWQ